MCVVAKEKGTKVSEKVKEEKFSTEICMMYEEDQSWKRKGDPTEDL